MYAPPPQVNLLVIRSKDIELAAEFYSKLGLLFRKDRHGDGVEHYISNVNNFMFEIYPLTTGSKATSGTRFGFLIDDVDVYIPSLEKLGAQILQQPHDSDWGRRAVIRDLDGHIVELLKQEVG